MTDGSVKVGMESLRGPQCGEQGGDIRPDGLAEFASPADETVRIQAVLDIAAGRKGSLKILLEMC